MYCRRLASTCAWVRRPPPPQPANSTARSANPASEKTNLTRSGRSSLRHTLRPYARLVSAPCTDTCAAERRIVRLMRGDGIEPPSHSSMEQQRTRWQKVDGVRRRFSPSRLSRSQGRRRRARAMTTWQARRVNPREEDDMLVALRLGGG